MMHMFYLNYRGHSWPTSEWFLAAPSTHWWWIPHHPWQTTRPTLMAVTPRQLSFSKKSKKTVKFDLYEEWAGAEIVLQQKYFTSTLTHLKKQPHSLPVGGLWLSICLSWTTTVIKIFLLSMHDVGDCHKSFVSSNWFTGSQDPSSSCQL